MSKVTIKFWNLKENKYEDERWLILDSRGSVYEAESCMQLDLDNLYEPHFYKEGERIA